MPKSNLPITYKSLLNKVKNTLILGQQRIEAEKVKTYWETGHHIIMEIKKYGNRADYGTEAVQQLSKDLGVEDSTLHRCVQLAKKYTKAQIVARGRQFKWSHYRKLIAIVDDRERSLLEKKIDQNNWSAEELGVRIKSRKFNTITVKEETASKQDLLTPKRGALYTYRLVQRPTLGWRITDSPLQLDLGFGVFRDVEPRVASRFAAEQIVESLKKDGTYSISASERTAKDLFTYAAYIERVIDADTLKVRVDLGFGIWHRETLRLRDIDSPEVGTKGGDAAKAFVQSLLKEADTIILHTTRSDKYDRYLADVFIGTDTFLNNLLLEEDHALRV